MCILFIVFVFCLSGNVNGQTIIASQSFDNGASGYADNLNYTLNTATYINLSNSTSQSAPNSLRFSNNNAQNDRSSYVLFDDINISSYSNVTVSVSFKATNVDRDEDLYLGISYDGGNNFNFTQLIDGDNSNENIEWGAPDTDGTTASNPYSFNIPTNNNQLRIVVYALNLDDNEFFYIDNVVVQGQKNYCDSRGNNSDGYTTGIRHVGFNTINNPTNEEDNDYSDFTGISTTVTKGNSYNLSVNVNTDGDYLIYTYAWIDWNQDKDFDDPGESYNLGTAQNVANNRTLNSPLTITIPSNAILGSTRMRISSKWNSNPTTCEIGFDGEVEDYIINVIPAGSITTGTISPTSYCPGESISVPYSVTGTYTSGNVFSAQISNASGSFATPVTIGTLSSTTAGTISAILPVASSVGNGYRIRVVSSNPTIIGSSNGINITITSPPTAPTLGTITQPTCSLATGSVILNGLPAIGTWTITQSPGGSTSTGTGTSTTISELAAGTYTYKVTNTNNCISSSSADVIISTPPTYTAPTIGTVTQPTCNTATGSVVLNGLPSGTWELTRNPGNVKTSGSGTSTTISNLSSGNYTYTVSDRTTGNGLKADYFNNRTLTDPVALSRIDPTINFDWGTGSPGASIGNDNFSVRWSGQIKPLYSENYTFTTRSDDGIRLWVNGVRIINNWTDHGPTNDTGTISLAAGVKYDIVLEFYENGGGAVSQLSWSSTSQAFQVIPQSQLYPIVGKCTSPSSGNVVINPQPSPPTAILTGDATICEGETADVTLSISGPGTSWYVTGTINSNPFSVTIYENPFTLPVTPNSTTTYSILTVTDEYGCTNNNNNSSVTINVLPTVQNNTISQDQIVCAGINAQTLTGTSATGGNGSYSYLWESSITSNSSGFTPATGTNNTPNYNPGSISQTSWFRRTVTSSSCKGYISNAVQITVNERITNNHLNFSNGISGTVCATTTENGVANLSAPAGSVFNYVNFSSYGTPGGTCGNFIINTNCHATTSQIIAETYLLNNNTIAIPATNTVFGDPCSGTYKSLNVQASYSQPICNGTDPGTISGTIPSGGNGNFTYLWESSTTGPDSGFVSANGTNTLQNYNPGILTQTTWFKRTVSSNGCTNESTVLLISVKQDNIWTGATNTDWNTASNWACNSIPGLSTNVIISSGLSYYPVLNNGVFGMAKNIDIQTGASLTVIDNTLQITGSISNVGNFNSTNGTIELQGATSQTIPANTFVTNRIRNLIINNINGVSSLGELEITGFLKVDQNSSTFNTGNMLTLISDPSQTALIDGSGEGDVIGSVKMQRYLDTAFGYKYFSSPFSNSTVGDFSSYVDLNASFPQVYNYDENNSDISNNDISGWNAYTNTNSGLGTLEGYAFNFGTDPSAVTVELNGTVNNGDFIRQLANNNRIYTEGYNLIGNPYPSPIDWNASGWTKTNIDNGIYFFSATTQYKGTYSSFVNNISSADGKASNIIPSMQGFFVHVSDGGDSSSETNGILASTNEVRVNNFTQQFIKKTEPNPISLIRLSAGIKGNLAKDAMVIYFDDYADEAFEKNMDALKLMNTDERVPNLYSITSKSEKLSINALPASFKTTNQRIPLGIYSEMDGEMNIHLKEIENLPSNFFVYLIDDVKRIGQNLSEIPEYNFRIIAGEHNSRFFLMFSEYELTDPALAFDEPFSIKTINGKVYVNLNLDDGISGVLMATTVTGQVLEVKNVTGNETISIDGIKSSGVYFINLTWEGQQFSKKIMIQK